jgi:hypothetical protein
MYNVKELIVINPSMSAKTLVLKDDYIDVKGNKFSGTVNLAPFSSIILLAKNNAFKIAASK